MKRIVELIKKHRELILYLVFGVLTTAVSIGSYTVLTRLLFQGLMDSDEGTCIIVSSVISWILSVSFAYVTNKLWVFESKKRVLIEMAEFFGGRIVSLLADLLIMWLFATVIGINDMAVKILSNVFVVVFNYIASKFFIFKKSGS